MDIFLCVTPDEKNKLNKSISDSIHFEGILREETSIIKPSIVIEAENISDYNYMYIPQFGRYYFISNIISVKNNLWRVIGTVDVLMSFRESINTCPIILKSTEITEAESYMLGSPWRTLVKTKTDIINFPSGLNNNGEYILITSGG